MLYEKILIMGHTKEGKRFRPSDWAERLYYAVADYNKRIRLITSPYNVEISPQKEYRLQCNAR